MYKTYRNKLNTLLAKAERQHYFELFDINRHNLVKTWSMIKELINKKKSSNIQTSFMINNKYVADKRKICESFNDFFINIGSKLSADIPRHNKSPTFYISNHIFDTIYLEPVTENEVENIIINLKNSSPGWDDFTAKIVKLSYPSFIIPLTYICNLSLSSGIVPNDLKIAKVIPIFKSKERNCINNYRPVSVLPVFSKILERLVYNRLLKFINKHNVLYPNQFGFQANRSTSMALITLIDKITESIDNGNNVLGIFLDFSKAFDTVDHSILIEKLQCYGIRGLALLWIKNYLNNRKQYVSYNGVKSNLLTIKCGVPQGSILGPLLFLLYINDIANVSEKIFLLLFADDSNAFISGSDINDLILEINNELKQLVIWINIIKLSLNIDKTHYMIFTSSKHLAKTKNNVVIKNIIISQVTTTKFLGVILDDKLTWKPHIASVKGKLSKCIGILTKVRNVLNKKGMILLYYSFLYPYLSFCIEVWGKSCPTYLSSLFIVQKRAVRLISFSPYLSHTDPIFKSLQILKLNDIYKYSVALFMYKFVMGYLPLIYNNMFNFNLEFHNYNTRQSKQLHVSRGRLNIRRRTIGYNGVFIWNELMKFISINCSLHSFKLRLKRYILGT